MKSRISIDVDAENGNAPVIKIVQQQSSDVRDGLLQQFIQSFKHTTRWLKIEYKGNHPSSSEDGSPDASYRHYYNICPITDSEIEEEIRLMQAYLQTKRAVTN